MAERVHRPLVADESIRPAAAVPNKISWGAVFGGTVVALGVWLLLAALGLALGLSSVDPDNPRSLQSAGIFSGIWGLVAPLVALFFGGMVAARSAGVQDRGSGSIHGAVVWGLTSLLGLFLVGTLLTSVVGGATRLVGGIAGGAGKAVAGAVQGGGVGQAAESLGLNWNDALAPINQRLQAEGKPAVTATQLQAAARDIVDETLRGQPLDRQALVSNIAQNTALSRRDADEVASRIETQVNQARTQIGARAEGALQDVQQGALSAAETTGKVFWGVFGALLLGLIASIVGALVGLSRRQRVAAGELATRRTIEPSAAPRREVHP